MHQSHRPQVQRQVLQAYVLCERNLRHLCIVPEGLERGGVNVRGVFVLGGYLSGGNCPGGNCPDTYLLMVMLHISVIIVFWVSQVQ